MADYECDSSCAIYVAIALSHAMFYLQTHDDIITTSSALGALYRMPSAEQRYAQCKTIASVGYPDVLL
jgi:hypothetical protein